jgi:hypothetical protein
MKVVSQLKKVINIRFTIQLIYEYKTIDSLPVKSPSHDEVIVIYANLISIDILYRKILSLNQHQNKNWFVYLEKSFFFQFPRSFVLGFEYIGT